MRTISFIVAMLLCMIHQAKAQDADFTYESGNYLHSLLKYRKATFNTNETSAQSIWQYTCMVAQAVAAITKSL